MEREFYKEIIVEADDTVPYKMKLTYYLLTDKVSEEYCDLTVYGAEIDKESYRFDGSPEEERKILKDLFFRRNEAESFMKKLVRNKVTPMGLKYAVREHIGEKISAVVGEG